MSQMLGDQVVSELIPLLLGSRPSAPTAPEPQLVAHHAAKPAARSACLSTTSSTRIAGSVAIVVRPRSVGMLLADS